MARTTSRNERGGRASDLSFYSNQTTHSSDEDSDNNGDDDADHEDLFRFDEECELDGIAEKMRFQTLGRAADLEDSDDSGSFDIRSTASGRDMGEMNSSTGRAGRTHRHGNAAERQENGQRSRDKHVAPFTYGTSLPISIPPGGKIGISSSSDEDDNNKASKNGSPANAPRNIYQKIRAQARSIQPADDPERLFGERPTRRRYQTMQSDVPPAPAPPVVQPTNEGPILIVASNVYED